MSELTALVPSRRFSGRRSPSGSDQLREAYELFGLEKQGALRSPATLEFYDLHLGKFFQWLSARCPDVRTLWLPSSNASCRSCARRL